MAELLLPKQIVRVRFPSFAQLLSILNELKTCLIQDETFCEFSWLCTLSQGSEPAQDLGGRFNFGLDTGC